MGVEVKKMAIAAFAIGVDIAEREALWHPKGALWIRFLDIVISLVALLLLWPALVVVAVLVKMQDGGPILFGQTRIGIGGQGFTCYKFRSMRTDAEVMLKRLLDSDPEARAEWRRDQKLRRDPRITPIGSFLRKSSLDELPQLINVLRGEMSLVGPRPIIAAEIVRYSTSFRHYASVMPGITGLWQVAGRNDVSYRRRVAMDRLFARKRSFKLYLTIIFMTIPAVLLRKGSY